MDQLAIDNETAAKLDFVRHGDVEKEASWEGLFLHYTQIQRAQLSDQAQDLVIKDASATIAGDSLTVSNYARRRWFNGLA